VAAWHVGSDSILLVFEAKPAEDDVHAPPAPCRRPSAGPLMNALATVLGQLLQSDTCRQAHLLDRRAKARAAWVKLRVCLRLGVFRVKEREDPCLEAKRKSTKKLIWDKYAKKMLGVNNDTAPCQPWREAVLTWFGVFSTLLLVSGLNKIVSESDETYFLMVGSLGALCTLLFGASNSPLVQPRNVIGGHCVAVVVSVLTYYLVGDEFQPLVPKWVAAALAPATAIAIMAYLGFTHPPAGAVSLIFISGSPRVTGLGWHFLFVPILSSCIICMLMALLLNNLSPKRQYPVSWGLKEILWLRNKCRGFRLTTVKVQPEPERRRRRERSGEPQFHGQVPDSSGNTSLRADKPILLGSGALKV